MTNSHLSLFIAYSAQPKALKDPAHLEVSTYYLPFSLMLLIRPKCCVARPNQFSTNRPIWLVLTLAKLALSCGPAKLTEPGPRGASSFFFFLPKEPKAQQEKSFQRLIITVKFFRSQISENPQYHSPSQFLSINLVHYHSLFTVVPHDIVWES
ncbi:hypothetical protein Droror1_Dr00018742 [Drosera rotundifolia]